MKPLINDDTTERQSSYTDANIALKYKLSSESQQKIEDFATKEFQQTRNSDSLCMDTYKNVFTPKVSQLKLDLFTGLNQTVKVMQIVTVERIE